MSTVNQKRKTVTSSEVKERWKKNNYQPMRLNFRRDRTDHQEARQKIRDLMENSGLSAADAVTLLIRGELSEPAEPSTE